MKKRKEPNKERITLQEFRESVLQYTNINLDVVHVIMDYLKLPIEEKIHKKKEIQSLFDYPRFVSWNNDLLYVMDGRAKNKLHIMTTKDNFIHWEEDLILICDWIQDMTKTNNNRIVIRDRYACYLLNLFSFDYCRIYSKDAVAVEINEHGQGIVINDRNEIQEWDFDAASKKSFQLKIPMNEDSKHFVNKEPNIKSMTIIIVNKKMHYALLDVKYRRILVMDTNWKYEYEFSYQDLQQHFFHIYFYGQEIILHYDLEQAKQEFAIFSVEGMYLRSFTFTFTSEFMVHSFSFSDTGIACSYPNQNNVVLFQS